LIISKQTSIDVIFLSMYVITGVLKD
jgi:hypothetical protein